MMQSVNIIKILITSNWKIDENMEKMKIALITKSDKRKFF